MKKRLVGILVLTVILVAAVAPAAMADHSRKCNLNNRCAIAVTGGKPICDDSSGTCVLQGTTCTGPHPLIDGDEPLAAEFIVASVERIDEPRSNANSESQVASLETPPAAKR